MKKKTEPKKPVRPMKLIGYCSCCRVIYVLSDKTGRFDLCSACNVSRKHWAKEEGA